MKPSARPVSANHMAPRYRYADRGVEKEGRERDAVLGAKEITRHFGSPEMAESGQTKGLPWPLYYPLPDPGEMGHGVQRRHCRISGSGRAVEHGASKIPTRSLHLVHSTRPSLRAGLPLAPLDTGDRHLWCCATQHTEKRHTCERDVDLLTMPETHDEGHKPGRLPIHSIVHCFLCKPQMLVAAEEGDPDGTPSFARRRALEASRKTCSSSLLVCFRVGPRTTS